MKLETAKLGERGQVTIPLEFRKELDLEKGETLVFIKEDKNIILKPTKDIKSLERLREDLIDIKIAEQRLKEMEKGEVVSQTKEEFLKDLKTW
jgi:AbrB family looped-hinge helix DNA binding protein